MHEYLSRPFLQVIAFTLLSLAIIPLGRPKDANAVYSIAGIIYGVFILANSVIVAFVPRVWPYFFLSMLSSAFYLLVIAIIIPSYISVAKIKGSGESAMIFLLILYHPFALLLVIFLKWLYLKIF